jgi:hypothetical protein
MDDSPGYPAGLLPHWEDGQPNGELEGDNCVVMRVTVDSTLNDVPCYRSQPFLCSKDKPYFSLVDFIFNLKIKDNKTTTTTATHTHTHTHIHTYTHTHTNSNSPPPPLPPPPPTTTNNNKQTN